MSYANDTTMKVKLN